MGLHTDTEIHRTAYDLLVHCTNAARNMPRDVKLLAGGKIRDELLEVFEGIYQANSARDKVPHIDEVRKRIQRGELHGLRVDRRGDEAHVAREPEQQLKALDALSHLVDVRRLLADADHLAL